MAAYRVCIPWLYVGRLQVVSLIDGKYGRTCTCTQACMYAYIHNLLMEVEILFTLSFTMRSGMLISDIKGFLCPWQLFTLHVTFCWLFWPCVKYDVCLNLLVASYSSWTVCESYDWLNSRPSHWPRGLPTLDSCLNPNNLAAAPTGMIGGVVSEPTVSEPHPQWPRSLLTLGWASGAPSPLRPSARQRLQWHSVTGQKMWATRTTQHVAS